MTRGEIIWRLHSSNISMEQLSEVFGVSRQRLYALKQRYYKRNKTWLDSFCDLCKQSKSGDITDKRGLHLCSDCHQIIDKEVRLSKKRYAKYKKTTSNK